MARPYVRSEDWHDRFAEGRGPGGCTLFCVNRMVSYCYNIELELELD